MKIKDMLNSIKERTSLSDKALGDHFQLSQSAITRLRSGYLKDTTYETGKLIEAFAKDLEIL
jgi:predicted transcriptional regulator